METPKHELELIAYDVGQMLDHYNIDVDMTIYRIDTDMIRYQVTGRGFTNKPDPTSPYGKSYSFQFTIRSEMRLPFFRKKRMKYGVSIHIELLGINLSKTCIIDTYVIKGKRTTPINRVNCYFRDASHLEEILIKSTTRKKYI